MNLKELYEASRQRVQKQLVLEDYLDKFQPDFMESAELVAAILGGLRARYEDSLGADCEQCFTDLMDILNKLDGEHPYRVMEIEEELATSHRVNDE